MEYVLVIYLYIVMSCDGATRWGREVTAQEAHPRKFQCSHFTIPILKVENALYKRVQLINDHKLRKKDRESEISITKIYSLHHCAASKLKLVIHGSKYRWRSRPWSYISNGIGKDVGNHP